ncbi:EAL domain-containing protein [Methylomicrobium sp. RS1]|uniref:EAL domain-containing protein n=1 Tax=Candidatus Methylomicrobium oryzae TaxID=2802053 RepID=UPI001920748E|nr:EAL domain-containing protein [Methylomicrobium sp. RS1]MBL1262821.1 EAL domain-containing protein [Methylomicrobium sp. RS1]
MSDSISSKAIEKILFPYFQPIICTASGSIVGYEVLARQYDENGHVISAGGLFNSPFITDSQLILWDRMLRRQALKHFDESNFQGYLAINISASWINYIDDFTALPTLQMLQELNIDKSRVIIEITESKVELEKLIGVVKEYRKHGLKVAIDDFGAGYSQLERVIAIRPDMIKLDMELFKQALKGGIEHDVVHLITDLCKRTGCRLVCEGVESEEEFFYALDCGAHFIQGYLFSKAEAEFKNPDHYHGQFGLLRKKFLQRTLHKETRKLTFFEQIKRSVELLRVALTTDFNLGELATTPFELSGVLRFYLCDAEGNQISPNFNFGEGKWHEEPTEAEFNWSWRSYFYQLLALEHVQNSHRIVASERYRDFSTGLLCKTLSLRLDEQRILLVDIIAEY